LKLPLRGGDDSCTTAGSSALIYASVDLVTIILVVEGPVSSLLAHAWYTYVDASDVDVVIVPFASYIVKLAVTPLPTFLCQCH